MFVIFFFFFQAEDGIRDLYVTGDQTCALPIWLCSAQHWTDSVTRSEGAIEGERARMARSEARRVGKECRSWWSPYQYKKNGRGEAPGGPWWFAEGVAAWFSGIDAGW